MSEIENPGAFRNLGPDPKRRGFWTVEVLTAEPGRWYHFEGIWATDEADMRRRAAELARTYITHQPKPVEVERAEHEKFMRDIAIWGCE